MTQTRLSEKDMWDSMYEGQLNSRCWPYPNQRCSAYEMDEVFRKYLPKEESTRIIEMGCGGSRWLPYFAKALNYDVHGVDYSDLGCQMALENLRKVGKTGSIYCEDFDNLGDHLLNSFEVVMSLGVIEHFERPEEILGKFGKCLTKKGFMVTYVPNLAGIMGGLMKRLNKPLYDTHNLFHVDDLVRYHQKAGLRVIFSSYLEYCDFSILPLEGLPKPVMLIAKNLIHIMNKFRLFSYRSFSLRPQSAFLCAAMIVIAQKND